MEEALRNGNLFIYFSRRVLKGQLQANFKVEITVYENGLCNVLLKLIRTVERGDFNLKNQFLGNE